jgi:hypothetical protein
VGLAITATGSGAISREGVRQRRQKTAADVHRVIIVQRRPPWTRHGMQ